MKGQDFLDAMGHIDPQYIRDADRVVHPVRRWRQWTAAAACLALSIAAVALAWPSQTVSIAPSTSAEHPATPMPTGLPTQFSSSTTKPTTKLTVTELGTQSTVTQPTGGATQSRFHYNQATMASGARVYIPGYFVRDLSTKELTAVTPKRWQNYSLSCSGSAGFDGKGNLLEVYVSLPIPAGGDMHITMASSPITQDYVLDVEPVTSVYEGVTYTLYEMPANGDVWLEATATIHQVYYRFKATATAGKAAEVKTYFEQYLIEFSNNRAQLSMVVAEEIPEWFDRTPTYAEALADEDFGGYMLQSVPAGYKSETLRRYKDYQQDYLSGLWCKGLQDISWRVRRYDETADAPLETAVADTENYDLGFYPIPRAESVPEQLWAIVDNPIFDADELTLAAVEKRAYRLSEDNHQRMRFSVRYGEYVVEVSTVGVSPQWLYDRLMELK